jgi:hypothetical protein
VFRFPRQLISIGMPALDQSLKPRFGDRSLPFTAPGAAASVDLAIPERIPLLARLLIAAALALFFTRWPWNASPGLDPSWAMASDFAFRHGLKFGTEFIFTAGPYSFLHTFFFSPDTYPYVVASDLFLTALFLAPLVLLGTRWSALAYVPACFGVHVMLPTADALFAAAALSLFALCLTWRRVETVALVALCAPVLLAKYSFPVWLIPLLALADLWHLAIGRRWPIFIPAVSAALVASWLFAGQDLGSLPAAIANTIDITSYYGRAMQIVGKQRELVWFSIAVLTLYAFIGMRLVSSALHGPQNSVVRCLFFAAGLGWVLLIAFKAGYIRQDEHIFIAWKILLLSVPIVAVFLGPMGGENLMAGSVAKAGPVFLAAGVCAAALVLWSYTGWQLFWELRFPGLHKAAYEQQQRGAIQAMARPFPSVVGTVDAIPWEIGELIASGLDYRPRPVIQSFSSYSPRLQALDRDHFQGPRAPQTLFLRIEDIDGRLPTMATGPSLPVIGQWYDAVDNTAPLGLVLHRRQSPRAASREQLGEAEFRIDQWVTVPQPETGLILARVTLARTLRGRLVTFFYREPLLFITVRTASGSERRYRFIPSMGEVEFAISPQPVSDGSIAAAGLLDSEQFPALSERVVAFRISGSRSARRSFGIGHASFSKFLLEPGFAAAATGKIK